ncbi:MAG: hypothetical protein AAF633_20845 [Chloroflexota bacterium]
MKQESILRYGGLAAVASVCFAIVFIAIFAAVGPGNSPAGTLGMLSNTVSLLAPILGVAAIAVLFTDLRHDAKQLALFALLFYGVTDIVGMFFDPINVPPVPWGVLTVAHGFGILLFSWLQYRHPRYPNGLAILGLIAAGLFLLTGAALIVTASVESIGPLPLLVMLSKNGWLAWLGWHFLRNQPNLLRTAQS